MVSVCRMCEYKVDIKRMVAGFVLERSCDVCGKFPKVSTSVVCPNGEDGSISVQTGGCALVETY